MPEGSEESDMPRAGMAVLDWLRNRASTSPGRLALVARGERLTFSGLDRRVEDVARRLVTLGVAPGTRVAVLLRGGAWFVFLTHALARLGAVMVPLNARLTPPEVAWQLDDSRAELMVCDIALAALAAVANGATGRDGVRTIITAAIVGTPPADVALRDHIALRDVQGIIYTSATSGRPKGVMLSFGNHWWNAVGSALHMGLHRNDCWLAPLPLYHVGGLAILWRSVIYGIPAIVHDAFDPDAVNAEIDGGQVTLVSVVSTMLQRMMEARGPRPYPSQLRCVLLGGGPVPAALAEECLQRGIPIAPTYGLTEAASQAATMLPEEVKGRPGASGRPLPGVELRIEAVSRDQPRAEADRTNVGGVIGEIVIRGPTVMQGYAGHPEETAQALHDGWLRTGDLGYLDDEGYLYVVDRREDLIVSGGENVYPAEVEAVLLAHPAVADAGVIGITDPAWGQAVAAAITVRPGMGLTEEEVRTFCASRLARYKIPRRIWFADGLPRSPAGKLIRRTIRERLVAAGRERP